MSAVNFFFPSKPATKKKKMLLFSFPFSFVFWASICFLRLRTKTFTSKLEVFGERRKKHITTQFCEKRILDAVPLYSYAYSDISYIQIRILFYFYFCLEKKKFNCYTRPAPPLWRFQMRLHLSFLLLLIFYETNINKKHKNKPIHVQ